jgi:hypothetical protein
VSSLQDFHASPSPFFFFYKSPTILCPLIKQWSWELAFTEFIGNSKASSLQDFHASPSPFFFFFNKASPTISCPLIKQWSWELAFTELGPACVSLPVLLQTILIINQLRYQQISYAV